MATYDSWKTREPEWDGPDPEDEPEAMEVCPECLGEGAIEYWQAVSKWSIDPPCAHVLPCSACGGSGVYLCDAGTISGLTLYDLEERCGTDY